MAARWKASLLRARQAQEDMARERLAHANAHFRSAAAVVDGHDRRVCALVADDQPVTVVELIAAAELRARAAATLVGARHDLAVAHDQITARSLDLRSAARTRRSAEKLVEREVSAAALADARSTQRELDELGGRRPAADHR